MDGRRERRVDIKIDDMDLKIIRILQNNGREKLVDIGKKVGLTHPTVKERIGRLIESGLVKIQANLNIRAINYIVGFIGLEVIDPTVVQFLVENLAKCPRVLLIGYGSGDYNMFLVLIAPDVETLSGFIENNLRRIDAVRKISFSIGNIYYPDFLPARVVEEKECLKVCEECEFKNVLKICPGCRPE